ncbi:hypothetical protein OC498_04875 [Acinetobacter bohemicus]|uniref:Uncharacterized protein n=1 Tax=Acinetobacter lwoffii TaxID=28090 RepID=A0A9D2UT58_ACILW|nr:MULTISPECIES: hypothetical protein [Acinetobacter]MDM1782622.1 hypothetical protein [Acinetobacter indicus]HJF28476.1 hypothetical protein [Acinetobacter lwoffii]MCO8043346.1 hypothetical protein [Acinetobacter sp. S4400-12]MCU7224238.1 hypothetical protein [Acinetobacter bohemicus]QKQ69677.1 hypothetical protein E5Y90_05260 [Acinetobacter sp. 10FS3-1]
MVQLIKKGGLRERANRSRRYQDSENTVTALKPNRYTNSQKQEVFYFMPEEKKIIPPAQKPD